MSETTSASPKKASASSAASKPAKKARTTPNHPKVSEMVNAAISNLKERGGSSLQAIKKYIGANYSVDVEKIAPFIRKYLKTAVTNGTLIQTKGKGASGSFKLGSAGKKTTADKDSVAVKKPVDKKPSAAKAKEAKSAAKVAKAKSPSKSMAKKSPSKGAKKASKEKVKKTPTKAKTPKPKKAASKSTAKSAAAPKQESTTAQAD